MKKLKRLSKQICVLSLGLFLIGIVMLMIMAVLIMLTTRSYDMPEYINRILLYLVLLIPVALITGTINNWQEIKKEIINQLR